MLPGMYVIEDDAPARVDRIIATSVNGAGGIPAPSTLYELTLADGTHATRQTVHGTPIGWTPAQVALYRWHALLLPACTHCFAPAGHRCLSVCSGGMNARVHA